MKTTRFTYKKTAAGLMSLLLLGSLAGCGGSPSSQASAPEQKSSANSQQSSQGQSEVQQQSGGLDYASIAKPEKISWCSHDGLLPENGQPEWDAEFEKLTGIKLEHTYVTGNEYDSTIELHYSADTVPNVFDLSGTRYARYASEGALADLTDLVHESGLYDRIDESIWQQCTFNGKIYGVPKEIPQACGTYVRKDWLDRLGLGIPTTYEEFITMLERFKNEIDECISPLTSPGLTTAQYLPDLYQGAFAGLVNVDGKWVDGMQQENMVKALQNMRDAYSAGLLDMEAITNTTATCRDGWEAGTTGAFCYWTGNWGDQLTNNLKKNVPEAEVVCIPPIEGTDYLYSTITMHVICGRLPEDQVAQVFKYFLDYMHDGGEGQALFEFGVEGFHWEQNGDEVKMLPSPSDPNVSLNKCYILPSSRVSPFAVDNKKMNYSSAYLDSLEASKTAKNQIPMPPSKTYSQISAELKTAVESTVAEIVAGNISVEDGLANYKATVDGLGLEQVLAELNG